MILRRSILMGLLLLPMAVHAQRADPDKAASFVRDVGVELAAWCIVVADGHGDAPSIRNVNPFPAPAQSTYLGRPV